MVDPISDAERSSFNRRVTVGVTLLVGLSGGLVALQMDPTPVQVVGAVALGLVVGYPLARFVVPTGPAPATRQRQRRRERRIEENPFADGGDGADESERGNGNGSNGDDGTDGGPGSRSRDRGRR